MVADRTVVPLLPGLLLLEIAGLVALRPLPRVPILGVGPERVTARLRPPVVLPLGGAALEAATLR